RPRAAARPGRGPGGGGGEPLGRSCRVITLAASVSTGPARRGSETMNVGDARDRRPQTALVAQKPCWDEHVRFTQNPPWQSESLAHPLRVQTRVPLGPEHAKSSMSIEGPVGVALARLGDAVTRPADGVAAAAVGIALARRDARLARHASAR